MSGRAQGSRRTYADMPAAARAFVETTLGSPVVGTWEQTGGFSPGCATRVRCADGTRAFVKSVGAALNPHTPTLFRREAAALTLLGDHPLWAGLLAEEDTGDWVTLVLEDVDGTTADLADEATMARLLDTTDDLVRVMNERVTELPETHDPGGESATYATGPVDLRRVFGDWLASCGEVDAPGVEVPSWLRALVGEVRERVAALLEVPADHVVHYDIRDDNLLVRPSGEIVFVDWGAFGVGPAWLDPLLARLERVEQPWFDASLESSPALRAAGDDLVTAWLLGLGTHLAVRAATAVDVNLPTLQDFRRRESARFLNGAGRRLGLGPGPSSTL